MSESPHTPVGAAFEAFKLTEQYSYAMALSQWGSRRSAALWVAFSAGFNAGQTPPQAIRELHPVPMADGPRTVDEAKELLGIAARFLLANTGSSDDLNMTEVELVARNLELNIQLRHRDLAIASRDATIEHLDDQLTDLRQECSDLHRELGKVRSGEGRT